MADSNNSSASDRISVVALVVSLVALVVTTSQVLQQYFATADGYRRCQESVMGEWGKKTRLRWRWRQFRFETLYSTPEIFMTDPFLPNRPNQVLMLGTDDTKQDSFVRPLRHSSSFGRFSDGTQPNDELVSWLSLLSWMHETTRLSSEALKPPSDSMSENVTIIDAFHGRRIPALVPVERSWDFQLPDIARLLAKTTLSTISIMARRMGMRWKEFRPEEGIMRAEGNGHVLTSTLVRTLGLVLQYNHHGRTGSSYLNSTYSKQRQLNMSFGSGGKENVEICIPSSAADSLGAGVIRDPELDVPEFVLSSQDDIGDALNMLDTTGFSKYALKRILLDDPTFQFPVGDLVALTASPIYRLTGPHTTLVQIPAPSDNVKGLTTSRLGRRCFYEALRRYVKKHNDDLQSSDTKPVKFSSPWVLAQFRNLLIEADEWDIDILDVVDAATEQRLVRRPTKVVEFALNTIEACNSHLKNLQLAVPPFRYHLMVGAHMRICVFGVSTPGSKSAVPNVHNFTDEKAQVERWFEKLGELVEFWTARGWKDEEAIKNAWAVMMLRAFCWGFCHFFVPGERVPIRYYGSQLPVWLS